MAVSEVCECDQYITGQCVYCRSDALPETPMPFEEFLDLPAKTRNAVILHELNGQRVTTGDLVPVLFEQGTPTYEKNPQAQISNRLESLNRQGYVEIERENQKRYFRKTGDNGE